MLLTPSTRDVALLCPRSKLPAPSIARPSLAVRARIIRPDISRQLAWPPPQHHRAAIWPPRVGIVLGDRLALGANDVVNPAAKIPGSAIFGMPIIEASLARTVIVNKRSMASGYAGLDNELIYMDKTMMVFGDAKKCLEDMVKALDAL